MNNYPTISGDCWLCGDIHGAGGLFGRAASAAALTHASVIFLGDIGIGFDDPTPEASFASFDAYLGQRALHAYLIRGNHDVPAYWETPQREEIEGRCPHITFLSQGPVEINGELFYVYPGGVSEDRWRRQEGVNWFRNEVMVPARLPELQRPYRGILGHVGPQPPLYVRPGFFENCQKDNRLYEDVRAEEALVGDAIRQLLAHNAACGSHALPLYVHGHFHAPWLEEVGGVLGRCVGQGELCRLNAAEPPVLS